MDKQDLSVHLSDAFTQPVQVQQYASSVPTEAKLLVRESEHQFTRNDKGRTIDRKMRTAVHYLNPPLTDGLNSVGAIYRALADAAFNYQQEHVTSYYEMFPRLTEMVLSPGEKDKATSSWLRLNYKRITTRVAHRIWHYMQVSTMLAASLINMINLGRYEGSESNFKTVASAFRASRINTMTPNYAKFVKPKGVEDYLIANGLYLAGQANDGTPIVSIPLYATDLFGNRGWHHLPLSTFTSLDGKDRLWQVIRPTDANPSNQFLALQANVSRTILQYSKDNQPFDFRMPQIENMGMVYVTNKDSLSASGRSGGGGNQKSVYGSWDEGSLFIRSIYNNYGSWSKYITKYFADFADVTSDWYRIVTETLGIAEESKTTATIISAVRGMKYATVADYLDKSRFGASNRATCATIIKYMPYMGEIPDEQMDDNFIHTNFERYRFWKDDMRSVIRESLVYPKLTPTVFLSSQGDNHVDTYYVGNTGPNYIPVDGLGNKPGTGNTLNEQYRGTSPLVYGQRALYDLVRAVSVDVEQDQVVTVGLSKDASLSIADKDTTSKVYDELRSALFVDVLPLIDDTDPYVCGLNYFFAYDSALKSQTELTLMNPMNGRLVDDLAKVGIAEVKNVPKMRDPNFNFGNADIYPLGEAYGDKPNEDVDTPVAVAHICNETYFRSRVHVVAFGGVGVCEDVINASLLQNAGSEYKLCNVDTMIGKTYKEAGDNEVVALGSLAIFTAQLMSDLTPRLIKQGEANSVAAVWCIMKALVSHPNCTVAEITLPFTYGAVAINANPSPLRTAKTILGLIPGNWYPDNVGAVPALQVFQSSYCRKVGQNAFSKSLDYMARVDGYNTAIERSVYGISHFLKTKLNTDDFIDTTGEAFVSPVFSSLEDGKLRLMGTTFIKALGERNTVSYWDEDHTAISDLSGVSLTQSIDFKRNDYVAEVTTRQRVHNVKGFNGVSGKQGDAPRFISSNNRRGSGKSGQSNSTTRFKNRRGKGGGRNGCEDATPEKSAHDTMSDHGANKRFSRSRNIKSGGDKGDKPFLDSISDFASSDQKNAVSSAGNKSRLNKSDVAAM